MGYPCYGLWDHLEYVRLNVTENVINTDRVKGSLEAVIHHLAKSMVTWASGWVWIRGLMISFLFFF